jgi:hypothetical protein
MGIPSRAVISTAFVVVYLSAYTQVGGAVSPQLFIGQDVDSIDSYVQNVNGGMAPKGFTTYTGLRDGTGASLLGLTSQTNYGAGNICAKCLLEKYPSARLAIGLDLVGTLGSIAAGNHDRHLDSLSDFLAAAGRTVYLRIGYEADMAHNRYEPGQYIAAYRRVAEHIQNKRGLKNVIFVWQLGTSALGTYMNRDVMSWWPGEDVVGMVGASFFEFDRQSFDRMESIARRFGKKVMICEAAPQGADLRARTVASTNGYGSGMRQVSSSEQWDRWFVPFFDYIKSKSDLVTVVSYINADWSSQPMWSQGAGHGYWGVSSIEADAEIKRRWLAALAGLGDSASPEHSIQTTTTTGAPAPSSSAQVSSAQYATSTSTTATHTWPMWSSSSTNTTSS